MKKLNSILISGIVLVFLNGCGGGSSENNLKMLKLTDDNSPKVVAGVADALDGVDDVLDVEAFLPINNIDLEAKECPDGGEVEASGNKLTFTNCKISNDLGENFTYNGELTISNKPIAEDKYSFSFNNFKLERENDKDYTSFDINSGEIKYNGQGDKESYSLTQFNATAIGKTETLNIKLAYKNFKMIYDSKELKLGGYIGLCEDGYVELDSDLKQEAQEDMKGKIFIKSSAKMITVVETGNPESDSETIILPSGKQINIPKENFIELRNNFHCN